MQNNKPQLIAINDLGILQISGPDAATFLQGQLTADINDISAEHTSLAACCDLKGRMIANFWIWQSQTENTYLLLMPRETITILQEHLAKYAVFSKAEFCDVSDKHYICFTYSDEPTETIKSFKISENTNCYLAIFDNNQIESVKDAEQLWQQQLIAAGLVLIQPQTSARFTPQMINLQKLGGVSFTKGCYLGQEVVARTEHLGKLKRHLYRATVNSSQEVVIGSDITDTQEQALGVVTTTFNNGEHTQILAVIQDRALENATELQVANQMLNDIQVCD